MELVFIANVLDSKEIEGLAAEKKIDHLEEKLEQIKQEIYDANQDKIEEIAFQTLQAMIGEDDKDEKKGTQAIDTKAFKDLQLSKQRSSQMDGK